MDRAVLIQTLRAGLAGPRLIFSAIGWLLLALAFLLALRANEARREWIRVEGEIVGFTEGDTQAPIVEYRAPDGETRRVEGDISSSPRAGKIGDKVPVLVDPANSETVRLGTAMELWFVPGLFGGIGGVFVLIGTLAGASAGAGRLPGQMSARRLQELRETGERVMARVTNIISISAAAATRRPAHWRLEAQAISPKTGAPGLFISQPIGVDPAPYVKPGDEIGIFIDRENPKICAFDFSMLPFGD